MRWQYLGYLAVLVLSIETGEGLPYETDDGAAAVEASTGPFAAEDSPPLRPERLLPATQGKGPSRFFEGNLGQVPLPSPNDGPGLRAPESSLPEEGARVLTSILVDVMGATGREVVQMAPDGIQRTPHNDPWRPLHRRTATQQREQNSSQSSSMVEDLHVRYHHYLQGMRVEGAAMMMHISGVDGTIFALNGEYAPVKESTNTSAALSCEESIRVALLEVEGAQDVRLKSTCAMAAVYGDDGYFQTAWKAVVRYRDLKEHHLDEIFACPSTGRLVTRFPVLRGARSLTTSDCNDGTNCKVVSKSSNPITVQGTSASQAAVDAHNYAIATYNYFKEVHGRDSLNNKGMTLISRANYVKPGEGDFFNNAFWDGSKMTYGNGDSTKYYYFSRAIDVVAHEMMHGITQYTSNLINKYESGAVDESMSDIFGALVKRFKSNKPVSVEETWLFGSALLRKGGHLRNMGDPSEKAKFADHYADRYRGDDDKGGVHRNCGIMNLAFKLAVTGGKHPRRPSINVKALDADFDTSLRTAARIWYQASTSCLTEQSQFKEARKCTILFAGKFKPNIAAAWDVVGVTGPAVPTPPPTRRPTSRPRTPRPTRRPTRRPRTRRPTRQPTRRPTRQPTRRPTLSPTRQPTRSPTRSPSAVPSHQPSDVPSVSALPSTSIRPSTKTAYPTTAFPTTARPKTARPTSPPWNNRKCFRTIQRDCDCKAFLNAGSRCWLTVAKQKCHATVANRTELRKRWAQYCRSLAPAER